jgi:hypothetical protein
LSAAVMTAAVGLIAVDRSIKSNRKIESMIINKNSLTTLHQQEHSTLFETSFDKLRL